MRQNPWSSSEIHQLVCNHTRPLGWVTPARSNTDRLAALKVGESCGGLSLPIWLLTHGGGLGGVATHGSGASVADALYSHVLPVLGRVPATAGGGASMIGSELTVMSSMKSPVGMPVTGSTRGVGVRVWMKPSPMISVYSCGIELIGQGGATLGVEQTRPLWFQTCMLSALKVS